MTRATVCILALTWTIGVGAVLPAQGTRSDYERANGFRRSTENKVFRDRVRPNWLEGGAAFWYRIQTAADRHEFVLVDAEKGERKPAFDHARLAEALRGEGGDDARADRLPIDWLNIDRRQQRIRFRCDHKRWHCSLRDYRLGEDELPPAPRPGLPPSPRIRSRRDSGDDTEITFVNKTAGNVEVFWVTADGDRVSYGSLPPGARRSQHSYAGHAWLVVDQRGEELVVFLCEEEPLIAEITGPVKGRPPRPPAARRSGPRNPPPSAESPDGRWQALTRDGNLYLRRADGGGEFQLGGERESNQFYQQRFYWSPDSSRLLAIRTTEGDVRRVFFIESSPRDQVQPRLQSYLYLKPGDRIPVDTPVLFDVGRRKQIPISDDLLSNPWSITRIAWDADSSRFTFLYNQRGHQVLRVIAVSADGRVRAIVDERSQTFIDYVGKQFYYPLAETNEILWMSERDGWNHLYLYDSQTGAVKNQVTRGRWAVRDVDLVDEERRQIYFRAGGIRPGQDPYYVHDCRVNFDGSGLLILTEGNGNHRAEFSPDRRFFVDEWSRVDRPPVTELRSVDDGRLVCRLEEADCSALLATGWRFPEPFAAAGRDGQTPIYGLIYRPTTFDPGRQYPVIEEIYASPHGAFVPKSFHVHSGAQALAELGFIVVRIDGMGTSHRSKKFHDVCWKNLGDAGFPDRIRWIKAAAARYPYMDLARVGIYGGSAGGQSAARALLAHGDFYKVAVADCGCHDNRLDKIWWNELWMGWPLGPHYAEQSNVTCADRLQGQLLLIVGEMDRNVDPASTMQVVDALIKADKDFEMLVIPGSGHGAGETPYGNRRRMDFLVRHLHGVQPRTAP